MTEISTVYFLMKNGGNKLTIVQDFQLLIKMEMFYVFHQKRDVENRNESIQSSWRVLPPTGQDTPRNYPDFSLRERTQIALRAGQLAGDSVEDAYI